MSYNQGIDASRRTNDDFLYSKSKRNNENSDDDLSLTNTMNITPAMKNGSKRVKLASGSANLRNTGGFIADSSLSMGNNQRILGKIREKSE